MANVTQAPRDPFNADAITSTTVIALPESSLQASREQSS